MNFSTILAATVVGEVRLARTPFGACGQCRPAPGTGD